MGRGLGDTQRAALTELAEAHEQKVGLWIDELADRLGLTPRRCRTMVATLVERGHARTIRRGWWEAAEGKGPPIRFIHDTPYSWNGSPVTADTPGAFQDRWGDWWAPSGGLPRHRTLVCFGPTPPPPAWGASAPRRLPLTPPPGSSTPPPPSGPTPTLGEDGAPSHTDAAPTLVATDHGRPANAPGVRVRHANREPDTGHAERALQARSATPDAI